MKKNLLLLCFTICISPCFLKAQYTGVTSAAHRAREAEYDLNFFFPDLDIEDTTNFIRGNVLLSAHVVASTLDTFAVELDTTFTVDSAKASLNNGNYLPARAMRDSFETNIITPFTVGHAEQVSVRIWYHGYAFKWQALTHPTGFYSTDSIFSYSNTEPYTAYTIFPCKQVLTDKADSSWFFITTADSLKAVSNGKLTGKTSLGNGKTQWQWKSHHPIAYYLVSFAVGNFHINNYYFHPAGRTDSMLVQFYGSVNENDSLNHALADTALKTYSRLFGLYPFYDEKLAFINVNTIGDGEENQTAIVLGYGGITIQHEIAHQWFGDDVTCASYKDIMINEGFAKWCEGVYEEFCDGGASSRSSFFGRLKGPAWVANQSGYVYGDTADAGVVFYPNTSYAKNGMMLQTLRFVVNNDSLFFLGLRNYLAQYHGSSAYGSNLRDVMENTTGIDLTVFFQQWYYGYGYPVFQCRYNIVNDTLLIRILETATCDTTPLFITPLQIQLFGQNDTLVYQVMITDTVTYFAVLAPAGFDSISIDPNNWVLCKSLPSVLDTNLDAIPVAITDIKNPVPYNPFNIYPAPANNWLAISGNDASEQILNISLFNILGQRVFQTKTTNGTHIVLPELTAGVYLLQLNETTWRKVEIMH